MRISISNIAWDPSDDDDVATLLHRYQVDAIDIAPGKYFADVAVATSSEILAVREAWNQRGIDILGMQALFFGRSGLNLFDVSSQADMLAHLAHVCRIAEGLGARSLVFGSPKCRDRGALDEDTINAISTDFFRRAGDVAGRHGATLCLEPNPVRYGCNFMTTTKEAAEVVQRVNHPAVRLHLDTGTITINGEAPLQTLRQYGALVGYAHVSEPDLAPLGLTATNHAGLAEAIRGARISAISIEMLTKPEVRLESIEHALDIATTHYRSAQ
ncbi:MULTISPECIES: sugar phosphate isomerase/epimerase [Ralstonia]|jgi:D-psicose/D-tagatose/L-ribulose 3-epimerase|uniref:sugar phosphate isomerase/epimerase family protein n=1 Tax=Ralstonia TaxID=48736 RepID=UPI0015F84AC6|nr:MULTISPECIES: sugar phosphate isomerase/epimerase [Ralstonia]MBB0025676.1 sugar phosphate isomerase/epimerase [Ralstonia pickettii]MBB0036304.1 sugar phosphate isomerase/epimerase [Ralstonia pickettii]MBB0099004.1 sugar phosphate isomerase/epimerase [Ralstonia pickettii]MBB0108640.1 sugar phosphate isomerase/epimerase [Ralstonia pickettii]MBB0129778.1 sugar phosphate isomerase/epimerase [Ralstonia pickettii]